MVAAKTVGAFEAQFGADRVQTIPPMSGSEDVGEFGDAIGVPLVYWFWGGIDPQAFADYVKEGTTPLGQPVGRRYLASLRSLHELAQWERLVVTQWLVTTHNFGQSAIACLDKVR